MAKLVFGMNQSLDGYVDHLAFAPSPVLFRHFIEQARDEAGSVYGRCLSGTERSARLSEVQGSEKEFSGLIRSRCRGSPSTSRRSR